MGFRLVRKLVAWMTLDSVMAVILRYSTEFGRVGSNQLRG